MTWLIQLTAVRMSSNAPKQTIGAITAAMEAKVNATQTRYVFIEYVAFD